MSEKGSGVMSMSVTDLAAEYGVTELTVNTWLKAISQPATESADMPAGMHYSRPGLGRSGSVILGD